MKCNIPASLRAATNTITFAGLGHLDWAGRRIASPALASWVIIQVGPPNSSAATQVDVCPVGRYNCRMEFLGRTVTRPMETIISVTDVQRIEYGKGDESERARAKNGTTG